MEPIKNHIFLEQTTNNIKTPLKCIFSNKMPYLITTDQNDCIYFLGKKNHLTYGMIKCFIM
jgi:hypothetical protein